jgi:hypothetical protein
MFAIAHQESEPQPILLVVGLVVLTNTPGSPSVLVVDGSKLPAQALGPGEQLTTVASKLLYGLTRIAASAGPGMSGWLGTDLRMSFLHDHPANAEGIQRVVYAVYSAVVPVGTRVETGTWVPYGELCRVSPEAGMLVTESMRKL